MKIFPFPFRRVCHRGCQHSHSVSPLSARVILPTHPPNQCSFHRRSFILWSLHYLPVPCPSVDSIAFGERQNSCSKSSFQMVTPSSTLSNKSYCLSTLSTLQGSVLEGTPGNRPPLGMYPRISACRGSSFMNRLKTGSYRSYRRLRTLVAVVSSMRVSHFNVSCSTGVATMAELRGRRGRRGR